MVIIFGSGQFFLLLPPSAAALTAILLSSGIDSRFKVLKLGASAGLLLVFGELAGELLEPIMQGNVVRFSQVKEILLTASFSGLFLFILVSLLSFLLPFIEGALNITTPFTLLRLLDPNTPVLKRLEREAPGTFIHSMNVGSICEKIAHVIGADALLTKVGAYYHDIGKIRHPQFFIENDGYDEKPHEELPATMSALIIRSHPKDGVELCKDYNLPSVLHKFMLEHHGTMKIEYFFRKQQEKTGEQTSETEFRYAGPKPQSRESLILMLADMAESSSRSLNDPNPSSVKRLIHNGIVQRFLDGQFTACDISTRELEMIEKVLVESVLQIKHKRIKYPGQEKIETGEVSPEESTQDLLPNPREKI
jgi:putative nucleotidyltransferase with HDIG domain